MLVLSILEITKSFSFDRRNSNCLWRGKIKRSNTCGNMSRHVSKAF